VSYVAYLECVTSGAKDEAADDRTGTDRVFFHSRRIRRTRLVPTCYDYDFVHALLAVFSSYLFKFTMIIIYSQIILRGHSA